MAYLIAIKILLTLIAGLFTLQDLGAILLKTYFARKSLDLNVKQYFKKEIRSHTLCVAIDATILVAVWLLIP